MFDYIERRRFLVHPPRKNPLPAFVGKLGVDLDESARQLFILPRRACLARTQAHDHVLHPKRLTRAHRQVAHDAVALVEHADHRDALVHWGHAGFVDADRRRSRGDGAWLPFTGLVALGRAIVASGDPGCGQRQEQRQAHAQSGVHG
jgi:hypothetical protein